MVMKFGLCKCDLDVMVVIYFIFVEELVLMG